jgi:hypothetical protein
VILAKTLVHKAAMPVAPHALRTFASVSRGAYRLEIHSDGSLEESDFLQLEQAANGIPTQRVLPAKRQALLAPQIASQPLSQALFTRPGYMIKLEVLAYEPGPFFYFDSDIVWLRPFNPIASPSGTAIFSTETWSWYYGIQKSGVWIKERIPRRINSGFAYLPAAFPFDRLETMLRQGLYTPDHRFSTDQELLAYLYPDCRIFSLEDFARSRRGRRYDLATLPSVALHFPGGMWKKHLGEIAKYSVDIQEPPRQVRSQQAAPLSLIEILRMYAALACEQNYILQRLANIYRHMRRKTKM